MTEWWRGAVLYQIYPRSFMDSNGDGIGDLKGIAGKLDYVKSLGVDGVWLSPFFRSPMRDFGYDVSDYRDVDPMFGSLADFQSLLKAAHDKGLKLIIDQVWSHTSSDHDWFKASRQDATNDKADWYVWADPKPDGSPPNNWQAWFGGPAWTWEPRRRQYYLHNFLQTQPQLNFRNEAVRTAILDIARFWLEMGVDGFRLDVANYYVHDAQLRDNPPSNNPRPALPRDMQLHQFNSNQPETLYFIAKLRERMDGFGARMTVGELAPGSYALMHDYTRGQHGLHTAYAFDFLGPWPGVEKMARALSQWREGAEDGWPSWAFSNHDVNRVATRWGEAIGLAPPRAAPLFMALLLSLRGTIFLYQGEELGLPEADVPFEKLQDPWGIAGWPATKGRDGCRTPIPWKDENLAGFTRSKEPWLPIDPRQRMLAAEKQEKLAESMLHTARKLIALRQASVALREGSFFVRDMGFARAKPAEPAPTQVSQPAPARDDRDQFVQDFIAMSVEREKAQRQRAGEPLQSSPRLPMGHGDYDAIAKEARERIAMLEANPVPQPEILILERAAPGERLLCAFNFSNRPYEAAIDDAIPSILWATDAVLKSGKLIMEPYSAAILKLA